MKLGFFGDLHVTDKNPTNRKDIYLDEITRKMLWAYAGPFADCDAVFAPGDVFDSFRANDYLKQHLIRIFLEGRKPVFVVYGQHDLRFHTSDKWNTPLKVLEAAEAAVCVSSSPVNFNGIYIYGASWGEDIPEIEDPDAFNVLVTHRMIIKDEKLWEAQTGHTMAQVLLRKNNFNLIVSGDNHQRFVDSYKGKWLVNMGSIMRTRIDQENHRPAVAVFDTDTQELKEFEIPIKPFSEVFKVEEAMREKEESEELNSFIEGLQSTEDIEGLDFRKNVEQWFSENEEKTDPGVISIMKEAMEWKK